MLTLKNIVKNYDTGSNEVHALKKVNMSFRQNEFVSILGQSGCGKTTLLNIVGGLDRYTSGDLIIRGTSTKKYKPSDWDSYRNHTIGFVFQSYNLIPHLTVLGNVELALTLTGTSKSERTKLAKEALIKVGLESQIKKKPNQLSGGQMQRVAIARALVNNPDIILADEPTGALDTETSIQVMELLKEVAKEKLVIMVTHNPEIAKNYSTRIIKLKDGEVVDDSNPYEEVIEEKPVDKKIKGKKVKKPSMSFFTALSLSMRNLFTKKARTILTSFAGSIGIIGIALILSISSGLSNYINNIEQETLSSYPLQIDKLTMSGESMMGIMMGGDDSENTSLKEFPSGDDVSTKSVLDKYIDQYAKGVTTNDMKSFKAYLENNTDKTNKLVNGIQYAYNIHKNIYTADYTNKKNTLINPIDFDSQSPVTMGGVNAMFTQQSPWQELLDNQELLESQYDVLDGSWPKDKNEVVIAVDEYNRIDDYVLYSLGLRNVEDFQKSVDAIMNSKTDQIPDQAKDFKFSDLVGREYKIVSTPDYYKKSGSKWVDKSQDTAYMKNILDDSLTLKVSGIIRIKDGVTATAFSSGGVGYTSELTDYIIDTVNKSQIVKEQMANPDVDVFTGKKFALNNSYDNNISTLGVSDLDDPTNIYFYAKGFNEKEDLVSFIKDYNNSVDTESQKIEYTDYVGLMMSSITTIIDSISYILIAFVTISLIVSSIMIGIITYISVLERRKEIGILRSIGARKRDISRVFNAETVIVGFVAGLLGIGITLLLNIPINIIIEKMTDISGIAALPVIPAIGLIVISVLLTVIAGIIPSRMAANKDPVVALRSE